MFNLNKVTNIKIYKATPEDAGAIQDLTIRSSEGMYKLCGWTKDDFENHFPKEKNESGANRLRDTIPNLGDESILLVAKDETQEINNQIVGFCFAERGDEFNRIEAVYVDERYQGTGLAKRIFDEAYALMDHTKKTFLDVFSLNTRGIGFYKKLGFTPTGKRFFDDRYSNMDGEVLEITEMVLDPNM